MFFIELDAHSRVVVPHSSGRNLIGHWDVIDWGVIDQGTEGLLLANSLDVSSVLCVEMELEVLLCT